jgi:hypothetical protein
VRRGSATAGDRARPPQPSADAVDAEGFRSVVEGEWLVRREEALDR